MKSITLTKAKKIQSRIIRIKFHELWVKLNQKRIWSNQNILPHWRIFLVSWLELNSTDLTWSDQILMTWFDLIRHTVGCTDFNFLWSAAIWPNFAFWCDVNSHIWPDLSFWCSSLTWSKVVVYDYLAWLDLTYHDINWFLLPERKPTILLRFLDLSRPLVYEEIIFETTGPIVSKFYMY